MEELLLIMDNWSVPVATEVKDPKLHHNTSSKWDSLPSVFSTPVKGGMDAVGSLWPLGKAITAAPTRINNKQARRATKCIFKFH